MLRTKKAWTFSQKTTIKIGIIVRKCANIKSGYTFLQIALKSAGGKPADFFVVAFRFQICHNQRNLIG
jgi:hypothetical protein